MVAIFSSFLVHAFILPHVLKLVVGLSKALLFVESVCSNFNFMAVKYYGVNMINDFEMNLTVLSCWVNF